ncbi:MAG: 30S ribosomal protein S9 [Candidatus Pacebacteria bacterium CG_4_10_14_0_8_um_filter_43_12]|nr:MAG: 30S ribosomal protein S9 [Candidatus Pacebacteria bacterium CG10_big_fil_rev_8_21_14_0_10_44_11]PIY79529.1 MAG: 30S ribosomal protein S9 [Candidatus Pacebacteria bacterium CG_4_10_14_0_8_um_filter_43_12]
MALKLAKKRKVQKVVKKVTAKTAVTPSAAKAIDLTYPTGTYTEGIGRRKVATARVRIYESAGDMIVNEKVVGQYFRGIPSAQRRYLKPFELTGTEKKFTFVAKISGSGIDSQLGALVHALSRALVKYNVEFKPLLKVENLLTRDDRMKETRKIGMGGKARRKRQSPKR